MHIVVERSVNSLADMMPLFFMFVIVVLILYFSYVTTKWIGGKAVLSRGSKYMKIEDTLAITQDKSIVILQADKKHLLLSVSPTDIKLITELENFVPQSMDLEEKLPFSKQEEFKKLMFKYLGKQK
jgi:Flagellar biogenesis protein